MTEVGGDVCGARNLRRGDRLCSDVTRRLRLRSDVTRRPREPPFVRAYYAKLRRVLHHAAGARGAVHTTAGAGVTTPTRVDVFILDFRFISGWFNYVCRRMRWVSAWGVIGVGFFCWLFGLLIVY